MRDGSGLYWYHNDHLGTPQRMTAADSGAVAWSAGYAAFGQATIDPLSSIDNNLRFPGQYYDAESGLHYNYNRYYNPNTGRYLTTDPFKDGLNLYLYTFGNPINLYDPLGLASICDLHNALDLLGMVPGFGEIFDLANSLLYLLQGDYGMAALSAGAAIPVAGYLFNGIKLSKKFGRALRMTRRLTSRVDNIPTGMTNKVDDLVGGLCFVKGTLVHTPDGLKPIEDIQVGDLVASKDESSGETSWKPVVRLYRHHDQQILNLTLNSGAGDEETFGVTSEHPFWVVGEGWTKAGELEIGDQVTAISGKVLTVEVVDADSLLQDTFNFEVAETHTYFVGEQGAWVHNNCSAKVDDFTTHIQKPSRPPNGGKTGKPNSIWDQKRRDGSRSVTYFDENGNRFSREDYRQKSGHGHLPPGTAHEHRFSINENGQRIEAEKYRELNNNGTPIGDWKE